MQQQLGIRGIDVRRISSDLYRTEQVAVWRGNYIAVDWGTTNRRAWRVDGDGRIAAEFADQLGLMSVPPDGFGRAVAQIREILGNHPMLLAGMVGSDRGWRKAPYVNCPVDAASLAGNIIWVEHDTGIIPGVCQIDSHADVMRGEEVQAIGALAEALASPNAYICHPGTHTKWIRLKGGNLSYFRTMMTGEIFNLLQTGSILSAQMKTAVTDGSSFHAGLEEIHNGTPLLSALFAVRARYLMGQEPAADASFASGLLIGSDVEAGLADAGAGEKISIIGRSDLCHLYASAIDRAGFESEIIDGDQAFLAGIRSIIHHLPTG
jgi:2-dehydro-3-deoxygalactonokinase